MWVTALRSGESEECDRMSASPHSLRPGSSRRSWTKGLVGGINGKYRGGGERKNIPFLRPQPETISNSVGLQIAAVKKVCDVFVYPIVNLEILLLFKCLSNKVPRLPFLEGIVVLQVGSGYEFSNLRSTHACSSKGNHHSRD